MRFEVSGYSPKVHLRQRLKLETRSGQQLVCRFGAQ